MAQELTDLYRQVFDNNRRWVAEMKGKDASFFDELAKGQRPEILYVGCADSRVPANQVMGVDPGNVFVHRNVANLVLHTDMNLQSVLEYAVNHLRVKHIVVCGHTGCGGVKAAMQNADLPELNPWLRAIRDVYHAHLEELSALDEDARYDRLIRLNVEEQCRNVIRSASVQKRWASEALPEVHGWVFDLGSGLLEDLELDFSDELAGLKKVYGLDS